MALFACLIICTFQLVFSAGTVFFSHNKLANSTFSHDFSAKRTGYICLVSPPRLDPTFAKVQRNLALETA
jgi:hypothetical protein